MTVAPAVSIGGDHHLLCSDEENLAPPRPRWSGCVRSQEGQVVLIDRPPVLFCVDTAWDRSGTKIQAVTSGLAVIQLQAVERVSESDLERITVA